MAKIPSYKFTEVREYIREALAVAKRSKKNGNCYMDEKDISTIVEALEDALDTLDGMDDE